jgi:hypothetical protein
MDIEVTPRQARLLEAAIKLAIARKQDSWAWNDALADDVDHLRDVLRQLVDRR